MNPIEAITELGLDPEVAHDAEAVNQAYRRRAKTSHPDAGGTAAAFLSLKQARDLAFRLTGPARPKSRPHGQFPNINGAPAFRSMSQRDLDEILAAERWQQSRDGSLYQNRDPRTATPAENEAQQRQRNLDELMHREARRAPAARNSAWQQEYLRQIRQHAESVKAWAEKEERDRQAAETRKAAAIEALRQQVEADQRRFDARLDVRTVRRLKSAWQSAQKAWHAFFDGKEPMIY